MTTTQINTLPALLLAGCLAVMVVGCLCAEALGDDPIVPFQPVRASVLYVHDADTLTADINLPFKIDLPNRTIRAWGYDAWEVTRTRRTVKITDAEIQKGLKARDEFITLLKTGTLYVESMESVRIGWPQNEKVKPEVMEDLYGRMLCCLWLQVMSYPDGKPTATWIYIPKWMDDHGHIRTPREKP